MPSRRSRAMTVALGVWVEGSNGWEHERTWVGGAGGLGFIAPCLWMGGK